MGRSAGQARGGRKRNPESWGPAGSGLGPCVPAQAPTGWAVLSEDPVKPAGCPTGPPAHSPGGAAVTGALGAALEEGEDGVPHGLPEGGWAWGSSNPFLCTAGESQEDGPAVGSVAASFFRVTQNAQRPP